MPIATQPDILVCVPLRLLNQYRTAMFSEYGESVTVVPHGSNTMGMRMRKIIVLPPSRNDLEDMTYHETQSFGAWCRNLVTRLKKVNTPGYGVFIL